MLLLWRWNAEWVGQGEFDVAGGDLNAAVALRDAVVERRDEERRMRIAWVLAGLALRSADVGDVKLLTTGW